MAVIALLEALIGIAAVFVMLSLAVTVVAELIQSRTGLRGRNLARVLEQMVGPEAGNRLMQSAYLRSLVDPRDPARMPSYLPASAVADAVLEQATGTANSCRDWRDRLAEAGAGALSAAPLSAREVLLGFVRESPNADDLHRRVQGWFNDVSARSLGWYRRRLHHLLLTVSIALVLLLNVDAFQMMQRLTRDPAVRQVALQRAVQLISDSQAPSDGLRRLTEQYCPQRVPQGQPMNQQQLVDCVAGPTSPLLGWAEDPLYQGLAGLHPMTPAEWLALALYKAAGLVLACVALAFGASVWFDLLKRLINLRSSQALPLPAGDATGQVPAPGTHVTVDAPPQAGPLVVVMPAERRITLGLRGFAPDALDMDLANAEWAATLSALACQTHERAFEGFMHAAQLNVEFFDGGATVAVAASAPAGRAGIEVRNVDTNGMVAWNEDDCFIVFCAPQQEIPGWFLDARMRRVDNLLDAQPLRVHEGLHAALTAVWKPGFSGSLPELLARFEDGRRRIWLTGHGLGGALAQMAALALDEALTRPGNRFAQNWSGIRGVYSFGAPRVGDDSFTQALEARCARRLYRFVNGRDLIARSPSVSHGFQHAGKLYYFDGTGGLRCDAPEWLLTQGQPEQSLLRLRNLSPDRIEDHGIGQYRRRLQAAMRSAGLTPSSEVLM